MSHDPDKQAKLEIAGGSVPEVPTFGCVVYVAKSDGGVRARVANLPDLESTGTSEREALGKLIPAFKQRVSEMLAGGQEIPWIDPPSPLAEGEQKRFVPVHL